MKGLSLKQIKQILLEGDSTTLILIAMKNQKQIYFGGSSLGFVLGSSKASPAGFASCSKAVTISNVISTFPYKNKKTALFHYEQANSENNEKRTMSYVNRRSI